MPRSKKPTGPKPVDTCRHDGKRANILAGKVCGLSDPWDAKDPIRAGWLASEASAKA